MFKEEKFTLTFKKGIMLIKMKYKTHWFKIRFTKISGKQMQINSAFLFPFCVLFEKISQMWLATGKKKVKPFDRFVPKSWLTYFDLWITTEIKMLLVL